MIKPIDVGPISAQVSMTFTRSALENWLLKV